MKFSLREKAQHAHWAVRMNWKNRTICFALLGITVGTHLYALQAPEWAWWLLALQFALYPHVLYVYGLMAPHPRHAEMHNMLIDAVCFGAWSAGMGFPLWVSFAMFIGASINLLVFASWAGWCKAMVAMLSGVLGVWLVAEPALHPDTGPWTTGWSMFTLSMFLGFFAQDGFVRALKLYRQRMQLQQQVEEIQLLRDQLTEQATRDSLTGLFNRRMLDEKLPQLIAQAAEQKAPLTTMLLDMDHFKSVNDRYGHAVGDQLLSVLARHMLKFSRAQDLAFRYGGDEFLLVFTNTPLHVAQQRAQDWCAAFGSQPQRLDRLTLLVTLSCGLASFPEHARDVQTLLERTDLALYRAKSQGRNQVATYDQVQQAAAVLEPATF